MVCVGLCFKGILLGVELVCNLSKLLERSSGYYCRAPVHLLERWAPQLERGRLALLRPTAARIVSYLECLSKEAANRACLI